MTSSPIARNIITRQAVAVAIALFTEKRDVGRKIRSRKKWKPRSRPPRSGPGWYTARFAKERYRWPGRTKKHSSSAAIRMQTMISGMSKMIAPIGPVTMNSGMKAETVVNDEANTGVNIVFAAPVTARIGGAPWLRRYCAFSPTTIASSTMMPTAMISANMLIMLMVPPNWWKTNRVANIATGMPAATQKAICRDRNRNRMQITSAIPIMPFSISRLSRDWTLRHSSSCAISCTDAGRAARCRSAQACRSSAMSMMLRLPSACRIRLAAGRPLYSSCTWLFAGRCSMVAISRR